MFDFAFASCWPLQWPAGLCDSWDTVAGAGVIYQHTANKFDEKLDRGFYDESL